MVILRTSTCIQQRIVKQSVREHNRKGVIAAKGDVKLQNQLEKEVAFYTVFSGV